MQHRTCGRADKHTVGPRNSNSCLERLLIRDRDKLIDDIAVEDLREVFFRQTGYKATIPLLRIRNAGSTPIILMFGLRSLRYRPTPVIVPPVPILAKK